MEAAPMPAREAHSGHGLDVCIVGGCGHVGLPLALTMARSGQRVGVYDLDEAKMAQVAAGRMPFIEVGGPELLAEVLATGRLELSADASMIKRAQAVILVVGTPIDEFLNPTFSVFDRVIDDIAPWLAPGSLVILRSTAYPGTTDWVRRVLAERGARVDVAFCPERISEGRAIEELTTLPQIVGADDDATAERAAALFESLGATTVRVTTREAELAKLFTNSWRYLKFAVANQFFVIAQEAGLDYDRILHAIRDGYPRAQDLPGPGFAAGPCLLKDTMQLSAFSRSSFVLGHAAMLVNEGLPEVVVRVLEESGSLRGRSVAILGMAFKAESDDIRASLSYKLRRLLAFAGAKVACTDPYVEAPDIVDLETALAGADAVVIGAPHAVYAGLDLSDRRVVDIWGLTSGEILL
ncbi:MAG: nucleotide sugar dehydrogenase [Acidimicrobiales bacterium]